MGGHKRVSVLILYADMPTVDRVGTILVIASLSAYYVKRANGRLVSGKSTDIAAPGIEAKANAQSTPRPQNVSLGAPSERSVVSSVPTITLPTAIHW